MAKQRASAHVGKPAPPKNDTAPIERRIPISKEQAALFNEANAAAFAAQQHLATIASAIAAGAGIVNGRITGIDTDKLELIISVANGTGH